MITFPVTPEKFIRHQEQLADRKLSEGERGEAAAWVEIFNLFYEEGLRQDRATLDKDLSKLDEFITRHKDNRGAHKFAEGCRHWVVEAWKQGAERSQHENH